MTNNPEQEEKPIAVIRWSTTSKISEYDARELPAIRKSACSRTGFLYYHSNRDSWEKPASINIVQAKRKRGT